MIRNHGSFNSPPTSNLCFSSNVSQNQIEVEFLELQMGEAQNDLDESEAALRQSTIFCGVLLQRLEELARFLSSLLQKKNFNSQLGYELRKALTKAVDRSLDLSRNVLATQMSMEQSSHLSDCSMIDLVDSLASSTIADDKSLVDSLRVENCKLKSELDSFKMFKSGNPGSSLNYSRTHKSQKNSRRTIASMLLKHQSESEEWSEPDRDVSQKRIGLKTDDPIMVKRTSTTSDDDDDLDNFGNDHKLIKKTDWKLIQEKIKSLESLLQEKNDKILDLSSLLLDSENDAKEKIQQIKKKLCETDKDLLHYKELYQTSTSEICEMKKRFHETDDLISRLKSEKDQMNVELRVMNSKYDSQQESNRDIKIKYQEEERKLHKLHIEYEAKCQMFDQLLNASEKREQDIKDDLQNNWVRKSIYNQLLHELEKKQERLKDYQHKFSAMEDDMKIMQNHIMESEDRLEKINKNLDNATLQLSSASVERSKALNEKRMMESKFKKISEEYQKINIEKQELNLKIADLEVFNAKLQNKLLIGDRKNIPTQPSSDASGYASEEANININPQIRSPSFSSTEEKERVLNPSCVSCKALENEISVIKKMMGHSKKSLEQAYAKLRNQNLRKAQIELDIKQQIIKTQNVLQNVRTNVENESSIKKEFHQSFN